VARTQRALTTLGRGRLLARKYARNFPAVSWVRRRMAFKCVATATARMRAKLVPVARVRVVVSAFRIRTAVCLLANISCIAVMLKISKHVRILEGCLIVGMIPTGRVVLMLVRLSELATHLFRLFRLQVITRFLVRMGLAIFALLLIRMLVLGRVTVAMASVRGKCVLDG